MDKELRQVFGALCQARRTLARELRKGRDAGPCASPSARQQLIRAQQFAAFAEALAQALERSGAPASLKNEAEQLLYFFQAAEAQVRVQLETDRYPGAR